eukprot:m.496151 g.496151  ORF g.496151 m.496151 type:complete len:340 (+) comp46676_c0_seq1:211-1230(+)
MRWLVFLALSVVALGAPLTTEQSEDPVLSIRPMMMMFLGSSGSTTTVHLLGLHPSIVGFPTTCWEGLDHRHYDWRGTALEHLTRKREDAQSLRPVSEWFRCVELATIKLPTRMSEVPEWARLVKEYCPMTEHANFETNLVSLIKPQTKYLVFKVRGYNFEGTKLTDVLEKILIKSNAVLLVADRKDYVRQAVSSLRRTAFDLGQFHGANKQTAAPIDPKDLAWATVFFARQTKRLWSLTEQLCEAMGKDSQCALRLPYENGVERNARDAASYVGMAFPEDEELVGGLKKASPKALNLAVADWPSVCTFLVNFFQSHESSIVRDIVVPECDQGEAARIEQ